MPRGVVNLLGMFVLMLLPVGQVRSASAKGQTPTAPPAQSPLGTAIRNLQQSVRDQANTSASLQFDTKGVDFGPWVQTFSAQVLRNWVVPADSRELQESAVIRFNIRRDGTISDVQVVTPASTALLTAAARNALTQSSPVAPLPTQYPESTLTMTVTFKYNPDGREFVFTGPAEFYASLGGASEFLTAERIKQEGLRFIVVGRETYQGTAYTKVRLLSRNGSERVGFINRVPAAGETLPVVPKGVVGGVAPGAVGGLPFAPPPPPPPPPLSPVRIGGSIKSPRQTKKVGPVYPPIARSERVSGTVILEATIGVDGKVRDVRVLRSIPLLDQAAIDAVRQWEYEPTLLAGVPTPVIMTVTVTFTLA